MSLLADLSFYRTYAALKPDGTKESWNEVCTRYENHLVKKYPAERDNIQHCVEYVRRKLVVPSMRLFQFAGAPAEKENLRGYNCSYVSITSVKDLQDILYLSSCGVGCGFSVQRRHIDQLPVVPGWYPDVYPIKDSRESWADSVGVIMSNPGVKFDYSAIRPAGAILSTGGVASGPEPLRECHERIRGVLAGAVGRHLRSIEVHSIACSIGHAIVSGGVRRSALLSLFDKDDVEMLAAKSGKWWETNPHFARANNSAVLLRSDTTREEFDRVIDACFASNAGEPGIFFTNSYNMGTNPCAEISLISRGLCNLSEVVVSNCESYVELLNAVGIATALGTYQAGFTDFSYVHPDWEKNTREEALLGVSLTGQAQKWHLLDDRAALASLALHMKDVNKEVAERIGINPAKRIGTTKPSGTTSTTLDCSSGIHAVYAPFFYRRVRVSKLDALATYLLGVMPPDFIEHSPYEPNDIIVGIPMRMEGIQRDDETSLQLLARVKHVYQNWIRKSHCSGENTHNVSVTVSFKPHERKGIKGWMWRNRTSYNGISLLPFSDATYEYAPYQEITEAEFNRLTALLPDIDLSVVKFGQDSREDTAACEGPLCEWKPKGGAA